MKDHPLKQRFKSLIPNDAKQSDIDLFYVCIQAIESKFESQKNWLSDTISLDVCKSVSDDTLQTINLADTIGQVRAFTDRHERENDDHVYFLPSKYNSCTKESMPLIHQKNQPCLRLTV